MGKITWEYLAGFTDGEGSLGVVGKGTRITWGNTDKVVMDAIVEFLRSQNFHVNYYPVEKKSPWKRIYMANICQKKDMLKIIDILQPLVITKVYQCENVRRWLDDHTVVELNPELISMWAREGRNTCWIAKQYGCSHHRIRTFSKSIGISLNKKCGGRFLEGKRQKSRTREEYLAFRRTHEKTKSCVDCGKSISSWGERCKSCALKRRIKTRPESFGVCSTKYARSAENP